MENTVVVDDESFDAALVGGIGWCPTCQDFTTPNVPRLATQRVCAHCGESAVCGAAHARKAEFVRVEN